MFNRVDRKYDREIYTKIYIIDDNLKKINAFY